MALRFVSCLCLLLAGLAARGQAFGRFGYTRMGIVPGFKVDAEGFVTDDPIADKIRFAQPSADWQPSATSQMEQLVGLSKAEGNPSAVMFSLLGVGFSLYFPAGIDLKVRSTAAPYLSWEQGSVAENVATPDVGWLVLSFRDRQPSIVLGFPGGPVSLTVTGKPGNWDITADGSFKGWMRVALPTGLSSQLANSAGALGQLAKTAAENAKLWTSMPPRLLKTSITSDLHSVTATWEFDHPGAVVPPAAMLAYIGGYPLEVVSTPKRLPGWTEEGPTDILSAEALTIRFPVRRVPTGRCLAVGLEPPSASPTKNGHGIPELAELALQSMVATRTTETRKAAEDSTADFVSQTAYYLEPWTRQQLPFDSTGTGIDLAAAHAFLMQAATSTARATSESNSLLTSVCWRQDWLTWRLWTKDETVARRAAALAALAGALCPEPERRLAAAMLQAGMSARRGLDIWRRRQGMIDQVPSLPEPLLGVRKGLFGLLGPEEEGEKFANMLLSPLRVFGDLAVTLVAQGPDYQLQFAAAQAKRSVLTLATAYPVDASMAGNLSALSLIAALGVTELHYTPTAPGVCHIKLVLPSYGQRPPPSAPVPAYTETLQ